MKKTKLAIITSAVVLLAIGGAILATREKKVSTYDDESYVTLPEGYKGMIIENGNNYEPSDEEIEEYANTQLEMYPEFIEDSSKTEVATGDMVVMDYIATANDEIFDRNEDLAHEVGSGELFNEVEQALIGMKLDESKDVEVAIPENYLGEGKSGTTGIYHITVKGIGSVNYRTMETLDDEFCQNRMGASKEKIIQRFRLYAKENKESQKSSDNKYLILQKLTEDSKVTIPQKMVDEHTEEDLSYLDKTLKSAGLTRKEYAKSMGYKTAKELEEKICNQAKDNVKMELILSAVANDCKINISEEGLKEFVKGIIGSDTENEIENYYITRGDKDTVRLEYYIETVTDELLKTVKVKYTNADSPDKEETNKNTSETTELESSEAENIEDSTQGSYTTEDEVAKEETTEASEDKNQTEESTQEEPKEE